MTLLQRLQRRFAPGAARTAPSRAELKGVDLIGFDTPSSRLRWSPDELRHYSDQAREGYQKNTLVYACVGQYTRRFPEASAVVRRRDTDTIVADHPILRAFGNVDMSESQLMMTAMGYVGIGGDAYLYKLRSAAGRMVGLMPLHAAQMEPAPAKTMNDGTIAHYWYYSGGRKQAVEKRDVIHLKWPAVNPWFPYLSMGPLEVLGLATGLYNEARRYSRALLMNDAIPRSVLKVGVEGEVAGKDRKAIQKQYEEEYGGGNRGGLMVLPAGSELQRVALNMQELALEALVGASEAEICEAFGVPPGLVGSLIGLKHSTFSNRQTDREAFYEDSLGPLWVYLGDEIDRGLREELGDGHYFAFNSKRIVQRARNQDALYLRTLSAFNAGLITADEARDTLGYDPIEEMPIDDTIEDDPIADPTNDPGGDPKAGGRPSAVPFS